MARSRHCLCFLLVLQRLTETASIPSNSSEHVEAVLPAPPRLASLAETTKEIERIKQKIHGDYVTYINGRKVVVIGNSRKADIAMCVSSAPSWPLIDWHRPECPSTERWPPVAGVAWRRRHRPA